MAMTPEEMELETAEFIPDREVMWCYNPCYRPHFELEVELELNVCI